jgi:hypothetical protein
MANLYIAPFTIRLREVTHFAVQKGNLHVWLRSGVELIITPQYRETAYQLETKLTNALEAID